VRCGQSDGVGEKNPNRSRKAGFDALSVQAALALAGAGSPTMRLTITDVGVIA
jgi:hypothetical protein